MDTEESTPKRARVDEEGPCDECKGASLTARCCRAASRFWCLFSSSNVPKVWSKKEGKVGTERAEGWLRGLESSCDEMARLASVFPYNSVPHLDKRHSRMLRDGMVLSEWYDVENGTFTRTARFFRLLSFRLVGVLLACESREGPCMKLGDRVDRSLRVMWHEFDMGNAGEGSVHVRVLNKIRFWDYMVYRSGCNCYDEIYDLFKVVSDEACKWVLPTARQVREMADSIGGSWHFHSLAKSLMIVAPSTMDELRPEHINWEENSCVAERGTLYLGNYSGLTDSRTVALLDAFGPEKVSFFRGSWDDVMSALRFHDRLGRRYRLQWVCIEAKTNEEVLSIVRSFFSAPLWWASKVRLTFDSISYHAMEEARPLDMAFVFVVELAESVVGVGNTALKHPAFKTAYAFLDEVGRHNSIVTTR